MPEQRHVFDSSTLTTFERCPRKFYWRYNRHLAPIDVPIPLSYGTALHEALFTWYKTHDEDAAIQSFNEEWTDHISEVARTRDNGELLLRAYFKKFAREQFKIISLEKAFSLPLNGFQYCGKSDGVVEYDNMIYVLDHKHTARLTKYYFKQYRPNMQMSGYVWAAKQMHNLEIAGALINVIHITQATVKNVDRGDPFIRSFTPRLPYEIEQFKEVATSLMKECSALDPEDMDQWKMCWTSCGDYGGCVYRDLCMDDEPERLIEGQFVVRKWTPLDTSNKEKAKINKEIEKESSSFHIFTKDVL